MTHLQLLIIRVPGLAIEEQLEILNQQWLLDHAPSEEQRKAVGKIQSLLQTSSREKDLVMSEIRALFGHLQKTIENNPGRRAQIGPAFT